MAVKGFWPIVVALTFQLCVYALPARADLVAGPGASFPGVSVTTPPVIDGILDDLCWREAPGTSDFHYTPKNKPAGEPTTAWLCYDRKNLYVAFHCVDSQPSQIRSQQRKRGSAMYQDDWVELHLDLLHDHSNEAIFTVNPIGTQSETLPGSGIKIEWAGDWYAAARRTDAGWDVEMAIPWSILRYDQREKTMGVSFIRRNARFDEEWTAPNLGEAADKTKWFDWTGLALPPMRPKPLLLAYSYFANGGGSRAMRNGLDIKQPITSSLTGLLTVNPDFATVEQDVESVDFTYTPRILTDRRPFFNEGSEMMPDDYHQFYSRQILGVDGGAKMAGSIGDYRLMALDAREPGGSNHLYTQVVRQLGGLNSIGVGIAERSGLGDTPRVATGYFSGQLGRTTSKRQDIVSAGFYKSQTDGPGGDGKILRLNMESNAAYGLPSFYLRYNDYHPDYNPGDGLVPEPDQRGWSPGVSFQEHWNSGRYEGWWTALDTNFLKRQNGSFLTSNADLKLNLWERRGVGYGGSYHIEDRGVEDPANPGQFITTHDRIWGVGGNWGWRDLFRNGTTWVSWGNRAGGKYFYGNLSQGWKIGEHQSVNLGVERIRIVGGISPMSETRAVLSASHDLTSERSIGGRVILGRNWRNVFLTYRQTVRRGVDMYLIFGNPDPYAVRTEYRVTAKLVYPMRW